MLSWLRTSISEVCTKVQEQPILWQCIGRPNILEHFAQACMRVHAHTRMHTHSCCKYMHMLTHMYMHTHTHTHTSMHARTHTGAHTCTHTHAHTHTHTHTHADRHMILSQVIAPAAVPTGLGVCVAWLFLLLLFHCGVVHCSDSKWMLWFVILSPSALPSWTASFFVTVF